MGRRSWLWRSLVREMGRGRGKLGSWSSRRGWGAVGGGSLVDVVGEVRGVRDEQ